METQHPLTSLTSLTIGCVVDECKKYNSIELVLSGLGICDQPNLSDLIWVEKLDLSKNNLKKITGELFPPNLKLLCLNQNKLTNISHSDIPKSVEILFASTNQIVHFDGKEFKNVKKLDLSVNCLESFVFPPNAEKVDISTNTLEKVGDFPENLTKLLCNDNMLTEFSYINNKLIFIDISNNKFSEMPPFPDTIESIYAEENYITELWYIPEKVKILSVKNNRLRNLYSQTVELPKCLQVLDFSDNMLSEMPELPMGIQEVHFSGNRIEELPKIPLSVKVLDISDNCLPKIPEELKKRNIKLKYDNNLIQEDSDNDLYRSSDDDNLFGRMFDPPAKKTQNTLDYYCRNDDSPKVTYYSGFNPNAYTLGTTTYSYNYSPPKPKYIYIAHKKKVVV